MASSPPNPRQRIWRSTARAGAGTTRRHGRPRRAPASSPLMSRSRYETTAALRGPDPSNAAAPRPGQNSAARPRRARGRGPHYTGASAVDICKPRACEAARVMKVAEARGAVVRDEAASKPLEHGPARVRAREDVGSRFREPPFYFCDVRRVVRPGPARQVVGREGPAIRAARVACVCELFCLSPDSRRCVSLCLCAPPRRWRGGGVELTRTPSTRVKFDFHTV